MLDPSHPQADLILETAVDSGKYLARGEWIYSAVDSEHSPALIAKAAWHGFLPMFSKREDLLLLKLHRSRTVLAPQSVHIGRQSRKKAAQFRLSVNEAFDEVVTLVERHTFTNRPGDSWLIPRYSELYKSVNRLPDELRRGVQFHSVELWHKQSGKLAAGEIGYTVGSIYSSCTGFALKDEFPGSGTLQLCALGMLLERNGIQLWDLGMEMDYKLELGGQVHPRAKWIACVRKLRDQQTVLSSPDADATAQELLTIIAKQETTEDSTNAASKDSVPQSKATSDNPLTPTATVLDMATRASATENALGVSEARRDDQDTSGQAKVKARKQGYCKSKLTP